MEMVCGTGGVGDPSLVSRFSFSFCQFKRERGKIILNLFTYSLIKDPMYLVSILYSYNLESLTYIGMPNTQYVTSNLKLSCLRLCLTIVSVQN